MKYTFPKAERLKSKKLIEQLFKKHQHLFQYPFKVLYVKEEGYEGYPQVLCSASKRHFKRAVDRNRLKRLTREAYRLHKPHFLSGNSGIRAIALIYVGKKIESFESCHKGMGKALKKLAEVAG